MTNRSSRITFWSELFHPYVGGVELLARKLLPPLTERGYEVSVITSHNDLKLPDFERLDNIEVHRLAFRKALRGGDSKEILSLVAQTRRLLQELQPDLVHLNGVGSSAAIFWSAKGGRELPALVTLHNEPLPSQLDSRSSLFARSLMRAHWTTAVSTPVLACARQLVPEITDRSSVVYNFVTDTGKPIPPLPFDPPTILSFGRMVRDKGFDLTLRAFAIIEKQLPEVRLILGGDGPEREGLSRLAAELGISGKVQFTGLVEPALVDDIIDTATVVAMPSRREGLPLAGIQAAMRGRPIVATPAGGLTDLVLDGTTGIMVEHEAPARLAKALGKLLTRPDEAARLGAASRRHATATFGAETCIDAYDAVYGRVIRNGMVCRTRAP